MHCRDGSNSFTAPGQFSPNNIHQIIYICIKYSENKNQQEKIQPTLLYYYAASGSYFVKVLTCEVSPRLFLK